MLLYLPRFSKPKMLKQLIAFILILAFAAQTFNQITIVVDYYVNTSSFAKNCENKAKPMLHCNGRCQMMKKLKQEENKDKQNPERRSENKNEVISSKSFFASVQYISLKNTVEHIILNNKSIQDIPADFFHPPGTPSFSFSA